MLSRKTIVLFVISILCCFLTGCSRNAELLSRTGFYFDTVIQITIYDPTKEDALDG